MIRAFKNGAVAAAMLMSASANADLFEGWISGHIDNGYDLGISAGYESTVFGFRDSTDLAGHNLSLYFTLDTSLGVQENDYYNGAWCEDAGIDCNEVAYYRDDVDGVTGDDLGLIQFWLTINGVTQFVGGNYLNYAFIGDQGALYGAGLPVEFSFESWDRSAHSHLEGDSDFIVNFIQFALITENHAVQHGDGLEQALGFPGIDDETVGYGAFEFVGREADGSASHHNAFGIWSADEFRIHRVGDSQPNPVPEPVPVMLFGAGLAGLAGLRRRSGTSH